MDKKIAILTFHNANNYGALLQAYALQEIVKSFGYECFLMDYRNKEINNAQKLFHVDPKLLIKDIFYLVPHVLRKVNTTRFQKRYLIVEKNKFDLLIVGSDQIWNPLITNNDSSYFGLGLKNSPFVISYAASMGCDIPEQFKESFFSNLKNVKYISVREETAKNYIEKKSNMLATVVLDPTLLLQKKDWLEIIPKSNKKIKPYIFVYTVDSRNVNFVTIVNKVSEYLELDVICPMKSVFTKRNFTNTRKTYGVLGPEMFLYYLQMSSFVITSSFHGTALSLALEKNFLSVVPSKNASRITDLLKKIKCENRLINSISELNFDIVKQNVDYSIISSNIEFERTKSLNWLRTTIEK